ncbi:MAG: peptidoglycan editing factor PgeF [Burkholderiaceae bacterium]|nr:peptidoglycan editing factor PgeF [Burkholderiaceae bacterium]
MIEHCSSADTPGGRLPVESWVPNARVRALFSLRRGGVSDGPYGELDGSGGLNLGSNTGDRPESVLENRARLRAVLPAEPHWLTQVHGTNVHRFDAPAGQASVVADASVTSSPGCVLAILTADCLPVLFADRSGRAVGAAHAGWRGLAGGVIEQTIGALADLGVTAQDLSVCIGPGIGAASYEVGHDVRKAFCDRDRAASAGFRPGRMQGKWLADLPLLARQRLQAAGIADIVGGEHCTYSDPVRFYSYRRDGQTGRMASTIWIVP